MGENPETCMVEVRCENFARSFEKDGQGQKFPPKTKKRPRRILRVWTFGNPPFFWGGTFFFGFVAGVSILSFRINSCEDSAKVCQVDQAMTKQPMGLVRYCIFFLKICLIFVGSICIGIDIYYPFVPWICQWIHWIKWYIGVKVGISGKGLRCHRKMPWDHTSNPPFLRKNFMVSLLFRSYWALQGTYASNCYSSGWRDFG